MTSSADITPAREGQPASLAGTVTAVSPRSSPSGRPWAIVTISDAAGSTADALLFCPAWREASGTVAGDRIAVTGKVIVRDGDAFLFGRAVAA